MLSQIKSSAIKLKPKDPTEASTTPAKLILKPGAVKPSRLLLKTDGKWRYV